MKSRSAYKAPYYKAPNGLAEGLRKTTARPVRPMLRHAVAINQRPAPAPADTSWDAWFAGVSVTADFLNDRDQPVARAGGLPCP